jgi:hypothetical protein
MRWGVRREKRERERGEGAGFMRKEDKLRMTE